MEEIITYYNDVDDKLVLVETGSGFLLVVISMALALGTCTLTFQYLRKDKTNVGLKKEWIRITRQAENGKMVEVAVLDGQTSCFIF
ncbi:hypothetical protein Lal_00011692 [Lupinus albus]|nr:hypothetical protein Lal_00011692 [Lupinus albus]